MNPILNEEDLCLALDTLTEALAFLMESAQGDRVAQERCVQASSALVAIATHLQGGK